MTPPMIAASAIRPTTTPTAMPTVLGFLLDEAAAAVVELAAAFVAVTMIVVGLLDVVDVEDGANEPVNDAGSRLPILFLVYPVRYTVQKLSPPPELKVSFILRQYLSMGDIQSSVSMPAQGVLHCEVSTWVLFGGIRAPHQQFVPLTRPMTGMLSSTQMGWQLPDDWKV
jgi:hypothetical protein